MTIMFRYRGVKDVMGRGFTAWRLLGTFPLDTELRYSRIWTLYSTFFIATSCFFGTRSIYFGFISTPTFRHKLISGSYLCMITGMVGCALISKQSRVILVSVLRDWEKHLERMEYDNRREFVTWVINITPILLTISYNLEPSVVIWKFSFFLTWSILDAYCRQFTTLLRCLRTHLDSITSRLLLGHHPELLIEQQSHVIRISLLVNNAYRYHILTVLTLDFSILVTTLYFLYIYGKLGNIFCWIITFIIHTVNLVLECTSICFKVSQLNQFFLFAECLLNGDL
jgi:hypothetical protein